MKSWDFFVAQDEASLLEQILPACPLNYRAVVTSCSHIFCVDCANTFLGSPPKCHICHAKLEDSYDLVQAELQPADLWKSLILAGLPPPVIIDIASRALSFWNYQQDHEKMYQTVLANHAEKKVALLEKELFEAKRKNEADKDYWRGQVSNLAKDLEIEKRKTQQFKELNASNSKAYSKLKTTNEQLQQQILLGTNPMSSADVYHDAPAPSPATHASRVPFVPSNNVSSRPPSHEHDNYLGDSASTCSFFSNADQPGQGGGGGHRGTTSRSKERRTSSDEGDPRAIHSSHHSRSKGLDPHSVSTVAQGVGGVSIADHRVAGGGGGGIGGETPTIQTMYGQSHARRPSSTATFTGQQSFFQQQSVQVPRVGGTVSAGAFRPANFGSGRVGSN
ncbi:uncharacterized protein JCM6883_006894 [Sporobolomyces salmoneus]|uniref:uncharacterized protein n=1 Tax=Sporobolomyces salmoneus TaxID=183962 RepID=UPI003180573D